MFVVILKEKYAFKISSSSLSKYVLPQRKSIRFIFPHKKTDFGTMTVAPWQPQTL